MVLKIAFRNLREHKSKSLIIGIIIALGIAIMILGNSLMETASQGIRKSFIENYTGHLMISAKTDQPLSLFGFQNRTGNEEVPRIPEYQRLHSYLLEQEEVTAVTAQVSGFAMLDFEDKNNMSFTILFGIDPESYTELFPDNLDLLEGRLLLPGEEGLLLSDSKISEIKEETGIELSVGDEVQLNGFGPAGFRIREVPIRGIYHFKQEMQGLDQINFIDVQSLRALLGMTLVTTSEIDLSAEETLFLGAEDPDDIFGTDMVEEGDTQADGLTEESILTLLGDEKRQAVPIDSGAWHYLLVKLDKESQVKPMMARLTRFFAEEDIAAAVYDWKTASGGFGLIASTIRTVFNVAILIIAVVAIIIIMNTLVISVIERTAEIGTMRALGAQKRTIRRMFILETLSIAVVFGLIGIVLGALIILILNLTGIQAANSYLSIIFGGSELHPALSVTSVLYALLIVGLIGIVSSLYPVSVALKIRPVKAIQTD